MSWQDADSLAPLTSGGPQFLGGADSPSSRLVTVKTVHLGWVTIRQVGLE